MKANRWEIENFVGDVLCKAIINEAERQGFEQATLDTQIGTITRLEYRNNERYTFDSRGLAETLWDKLKDDSKLSNPGWQPIGLNERFRVYKYSDPSEYFASHVDGRFLRIPEQEESWVTLLVYLNDDFEGGETSFQDGDVKPKIGMAALMTQGNYLHEALNVTKGTKYVLRTDVMYRKL
jgi:prolyl 4-hydroxylase